MKWLVVSATGEPQALRDTFAEAAEAVVHAENYWALAAACGHPSAPGYVQRLYPFRVRAMPDAEAEQFLLDEPTPILDREPGR